jgi:sec-independent protein translocase protein TatA
MLGLGGQEMIILLVIILVLFGGAKIPQMMRGMGEGMREFRKATRDDEEEEAVRSASETKTSLDSTTSHRS